MKQFFYKYFKGDIVIWGVIITLSLFSLLAVYSSTGRLAFQYMKGNTSYYLLKHTGMLFSGILIIYITHLIPYRLYSKLALLFLYITIPLLAYTLLSGTSQHDASRWISIGEKGITFQTSDFAKFALIMYIARFLSQNQGNIKDFKTGFRSIMIWVILVCGLIFPANFSTAAILFFTSLILLFLGRINLKYIFGLIGIGIVLIILFIGIASMLPEEKQGRVSTWKNRVESFFGGSDKEEDYQVKQAKIAIASGGIFGKGPGNSTQRNYLPQPFSDFIFAIIIEEYGIFGGLFLMFLYLVLLYRAGMIVKKSTSQFAAFIAIGFTFSIVFQAFINMGVAVHLGPVTGQTLPFVSMGGTSILFSSAAIGIVLSVSRSVNKEEKNKDTNNNSEITDKTESSDSENKENDNE